MLVLGIDTATRIASVGLVRDGQALDEESCLASSNHIETLLPLITKLLVRHGISLGDLYGIGVSIGPGSFTGLRIALSAVKGVAYALGQRVVGVPTLEALARVISAGEGNICPMLDARKGEVYAACFRRQQYGFLERLTPDYVCAPHVLLDRLTTPCLFLGDAVESYGGLILQCCGPAARLLPFATHHPRGAVVARMAWERLCRGESDDLSALVPCYVRKPDAEFKRMN
ncbi:MAG TPA: tRNA (adenosine(37)-N6)-threonylcarbamoyltransferase complex dimerization subunit type 1 TsaB [Candidatus Binatia bacterium]|nr:tRNA (adenosine(37)-N6)-threonylcarbamoyltransferase complex dimerization subunit type 1 TsaB [Candidatus Binatia bacterium]